MIIIISTIYTQLQFNNPSLTNPIIHNKSHPKIIYKKSSMKTIHKKSHIQLFKITQTNRIHHITIISNLNKNSHPNPNHIPNLSNSTSGHNLSEEPESTKSVPIMHTKNISTLSKTYSTKPSRNLKSNNSNKNISNSKAIESSSSSFLSTSSTGSVNN